MKPRRTYQDTVFRMLFSERENVIELFNALEGTNYGPETEVEFATLGDALYADLKNDLGFIIDNRFLILTEQQSTINENMCLRQLEYIGRTYEKLVPALKLYGKRNIKIPTPEFFVVYTGSEKWNASRLRLSDSFLNQAPENSPRSTHESLNLVKTGASRFQNPGSQFFLCVCSVLSASLLQGSLGKNSFSLCLPKKTAGQFRQKFLFPIFA